MADGESMSVAEMVNVANILQVRDSSVVVEAPAGCKG